MLIFTKKKANALKLLLIVMAKSLRIRAPSTNLLLQPLICWKSHTVISKCSNSKGTNLAIDLYIELCIQSSMYEHEEREHVDSLQTLAESKHTGQLLSVHLINIYTIFFPDCTECCQVNLSNNFAQILIKERKQKDR